MRNADTKKWPGRLYHRMPSWVSSGAIFHIRIRCASGNPVLLTESSLAPQIIESVRFYEDQRKWYVTLFLLMPDHVHALLSFGRNSMPHTIRNWKRFHRRNHGVIWQDNFFDHRIRTLAEFRDKYIYIERNPVVKGLCQQVEEWPWKIASYDHDAPPRA
jgi:putative transposase